MSHETVITLLWILGPVAVGVIGKWIAWSARKGVESKLDEKLDPLADELRAHMASEETRAAVNDEQHVDFRRRITQLETQR